MGLNGYTADGQDAKVVRRVLGKLRPLLADDERIYYVVVQRKPQLNFFPDSIVVTDQHLFLCEYIKMGFDLRVESLPWDRMRAILPNRTETGVTLKVVSETEIDYIIKHIPGRQAERLLEFAKEQAESRQRKKSAPPSEPAPIAESKIIATPEVPDEPAPSTDAKLTAAPEVPDETGIPETKKTVDVQSDSTIDKFRSLYLRQRITRSEYESRSKQQRKLEN